MKKIFCLIISIFFNVFFFEMSFQLLNSAFLKKCILFLFFWDNNFKGIFNMNLFKKIMNKTQSNNENKYKFDLGTNSNITENSPSDKLKNKKVY